MYKHGKEGHFILKYIIEDANVVSDQDISILSFLIEDNKISHYGKSLKQYQGMRMNVSTYFMTPGHVIADFTIVNYENLADYKNRQLELIKKGCTTLLAPCNIPYEKEFEKKIRAARHAMINSTIDYVLGVRMPAEKINPSTIRLCKRHKLPYILADISEHTNIYSIPWGWIRDAQFQYQIPIYPLWNIEDVKILKMQKEIWEYLTTSNHIPTHLHFPIDASPLSKVIREQIGVYPKKGELFIGNDLDYNLYLYPLEVSKVEESDQLDYDKIDSVITVHKGRLLKADSQVNFFPGFGKELKVRLPGLFASIDHFGNIHSPHL